MKAIYFISQHVCRYLSPLSQFPRPQRLTLVILLHTTSTGLLPHVNISELYFIVSIHICRSPYQTSLPLLHFWLDQSLPLVQHWSEMFRVTHYIYSRSFTSTDSLPITYLISICLTMVQKHKWKRIVHSEDFDASSVSRSEANFELLRALDNAPVQNCITQPQLSMTVSVHSYNASLFVNVTPLVQSDYYGNMTHGDSAANHADMHDVVVAPIDDPIHEVNKPASLDRNDSATYSVRLHWPK